MQRHVLPLTRPSASVQTVEQNNVARHSGICVCIDGKIALHSVRLRLSAFHSPFQLTVMTLLMCKKRVMYSNSNNALHLPRIKEKCKNVVELSMHLKSFKFQTFLPKGLCLVSLSWRGKKKNCVFLTHSCHIPVRLWSYVTFSLLSKVYNDNLTSFWMKQMSYPDVVHSVMFLLRKIKQKSLSYKKHNLNIYDIFADLSEFLFAPFVKYYLTFKMRTTAGLEALLSVKILGN